MIMQTLLQPGPKLVLAIMCMIFFEIQVVVTLEAAAKNLVLVYKSGLGRSQSIQKYY